MAQTAPARPLPDSGASGTREGAWIHDLTPTLSDSRLFDDGGRVQPLGALPALPSVRRSREPLHLVRDGGAALPRARR